MTFLVSPGVQINEFDISTIIPAVSVSSGAIGGLFMWGPLNERVLIDSETTLVQKFFIPTNYNPETWFTAADFLGYGNSLYVARAGDITGNTVTVSAGNTSVNALTNGSNAILFTATSGLNLQVGQVLFNVANLSATFTQLNPTITSINSTAAILSAPVTSANVAQTAITFRDPILFSAVAQETITPTINWGNQTVANNFAYYADLTPFDTTVLWIARYPGSLGSSLRISVCDSYNQFNSTISASGPNTYVNATASSIAAVTGNNQLIFTVVNSNTANITTYAANVYAYATAAAGQFGVNDLVQVGNSQIGVQYLQITSVGAISNTSNGTAFTSSQFTLTTNTAYRLAANISSTSINRYWEFYNQTKIAPSQSPFVTNFGNTTANDELHVVVVDENGAFTGTPQTVLEVYTNLSRATDAENVDGTTNYYATVINQQSNFVWWGNDRATAVSNTSPYVVSSTATVPLKASFYGGADGPNEDLVPLSVLTFAYDQFASAEDVDVSLIMQGKARGSSIDNFTDLGEYIIQNICQQRKDCIAFISPDMTDVVNQYGNEAANIVQFRNFMTSTSYGVIDTGYKYQYDRYNNVYRWIPLNGDIAGLCTRTDTTNDPWWSPAGFNRGQINNVVKLAYNPSQTDRDFLYTNGVNPVVTFPGQGTVLFGDKTMLARPSAFDRINVRRLFIVLEKAIATAAKFLLFEFNDSFTQATFKNMVNPYLRQIQGMRGITDFLVVCDSTNNTPTVVDANQFVGDIYIKPARSINFINLNFVAVPTGVAFSEVVGQFGQL